MTRLIWSGPARADLFDIAAYYRDIDPALAIELLGRVENGVGPLLDYPDLGAPTSRRGVRKWLLRGTPFLLFYAHRDDRIEIRRVLHSARDLKRLK